MAVTFVDDSGSDPTEPVQYIAGWVGQSEVWQAFSDDWAAALSASNPRQIKYFKHFEARSGQGCFTGFTQTEAIVKTLEMARVLTRHSVNGVVYKLRRDQFNQLIEEDALIIRGKVHPYLADPFYICMQCLVGFVLGAEQVNHPGDKVDFIFDGKPGSAQATRYTTMWEVCRELLPKPIPSLMGETIPKDDKVALPLQAADLLAGQIRMSDQLNADPAPLALLKQHRDIFQKWVDEVVIRSTISFHNFGVSTRRLSTIKRESERQ